MSNPMQRDFDTTKKYSETQDFYSPSNPAPKRDLGNLSLALSELEETLGMLDKEVQSLARHLGPLTRPSKEMEEGIVKGGVHIHGHSPVVDRVHGVGRRMLDVVAIIRALEENTDV